MKARLDARLTSLFLLLALVVMSDRAHSAHLPPATSDKVGFSPQGLERLDSVMQRAVADRQYGGIVILLARHGKVVRFESFGKPNLSAGQSGGRESIFRLASMSKPITGAAMMMLWDEGKWSPKDAISKFIPEFASLKVYKDLDDFGTVRVEEPEHPPTMRELLTHTAGFSYGFGSS